MLKGRNFFTQVTIDVDSKTAPAIRRDFVVQVGSISLPVSDVTRVDMTQLKVKLPSSLAEGRYDVQVQIPAGQWARLPDALTVLVPNAATALGGAGMAGTNASTGIATAGADGGAPFSQAGSSNAPGGSSSHQGGGDGSVQSNAGAGIPMTTQGGNAGAAATTAISGAPTGPGGTAGNAGYASRSGAAGASSAIASTLWTDGRQLRDTCGNLLQLRGVQQLLRRDLPRGNDWAGLVDSIAASRANIIRIHPDPSVLGTAGIDAVLARFKAHNLVAILNPENDSWLADPNTKVMLDKYRDRLIIDAFGPAYDDRAKFVTDAKAGVAKLRGYGYRVPLIVLSNAYGRDLPALINFGAQIVDADPLHNVFFEWDAYWGSSGWYQKLYGLSLDQGVAAAANTSFPILMGLTLVTDSNPTQLLDYSTAMSAAQKYGLGWLFWDWYNPYGTESNLSSDGTATNLLSVGIEVVRTHAAGLSKTTTSPCANP